MARRRRAERRQQIADPRFNSVLVSRFIASLMRCGKKRTAERMFYNALEIVGKLGGEDPMAVFQKAVENVKPVVEVKSRRVGGANYQVPVEVPAERRVALAIRWIISYARQRSEKSMAEKLAHEILQASKNEGGAVRKKIDTHKMADANRAFAHFRW